MTQLVAEIFPEQHIEKTGFAREVVGLLELAPEMNGADVLRDVFGSLLALLSERLQDAADKEEIERSTNQLARQIHSFSRDYTTGMRKHDAGRLLRQLFIAAGESDHADRIKLDLARMGRDFSIEDRTSALVGDFTTFKEQVRALGQLDRLQYQDDVANDPSAAVTAVAPSPAKDEGARNEEPPIDAIPERGPAVNDAVPAATSKSAG